MTMLAVQLIRSPLQIVEIIVVFKACFKDNIENANSKLFFVYVFVAKSVIQIIRRFTVTVILLSSQLTCHCQIVEPPNDTLLMNHISQGFALCHFHEKFLQN